MCSNLEGGVPTSTPAAAVTGWRLSGSQGQRGQRRRHKEGYEAEGDRYRRRERNKRKIGDRDEGIKRDTRERETDRQTYIEGGKETKKDRGQRRRHKEGYEGE